MAGTPGTCGVGGWGGPLPGDPSNTSILSATPAFGGIDVSWTYPVTNPHALAYVLLYRSITSNFALAGTAREATGSLFFDKLDNENTYYYWIRFVSVNGTIGELIGPASAQAKPLIEEMIERLTGQIDAGVLATALRTQIDQIQVIALNLAGEVVSRENGETTLAEAMAAVDAGVAQALTFLANEQTSRIDGDSAMATSLNLVAVTAADNLAAVQVTLTAMIAAVEGGIEVTAADLTAVAVQAADQLALVNAALTAQITVIDGNVTTLATQINTVQAGVAGAEANLFKNSSFEVDSNADGVADNWIAYAAGTTGTVTRNIATGPARHGTKSQAVFSAGLGTASSDRAGVRQDIAFASDAGGGPITLSAWVAGNPGSYGRVYIDFADSVGGFLSAASFDVLLASATTMQRVNFTATMPAGTRAAACYVWQERNTSLSGATFYIDAAQVQRSAILTGYTQGDQPELAAAVQTEIAARTTADSALATSITTAQATSADNLAAVQVALTASIGVVDAAAAAANTAAGNAQTKANAIGALYTVKLNVNGLAGGFGVYNDGSVVQAGFDVDSFWIGRTGPDQRKPFIIDGGVVYLDDAAIRNAAITWAKIGSLNIDANGSIRSGQTAYDTGTGYWMGMVGGVPKMSMGSPTYGFTWDGTTFAVRGSIIATGNVITNAITAQNSAFTTAGATSGNAVGTSTDNYFIVLSKTFSTSGGTVIVIPQVFGNLVLGGNTADCSIGPELYLDTVAVAVGQYKTAILGGYVTNDGENLSYAAAMDLPMYSATLSAGSHTLEIKLRYRKTSGSDDVRASYKNAGMVIMEFKR